MVAIADLPGKDVAAVADLPGKSVAVVADLPGKDVCAVAVDLLGTDVVVAGAMALPGKGGVDEEVVGLLSEDVLMAGGASVGWIG